jgi:hypothetical protein
MHGDYSCVQINHLFYLLDNNITGDDNNKKTALVLT